VVNKEGYVLGLALITMREELLSHMPSAHLEAIVVSPEARGMGLGRTLLQHTEAAVKKRGAHSLSLHVFNKNQRAKSLYTSHGFDNELIRAIKWLD
jgi:ribosomal protein S18 acetylase RimI-like enzyme